MVSIVSAPPGTPDLGRGLYPWISPIHKPESLSPVPRPRPPLPLPLADFPKPVSDLGFYYSWIPQPWFWFSISIPQPWYPSPGPASLCSSWSSGHPDSDPCPDPHTRQILLQVAPQVSSTRPDQGCVWGECAHAQPMAVRLAWAAPMRVHGRWVQPTRELGTGGLQREGSENSRYPPPSQVRAYAQQRRRHGPTRRDHIAMLVEGIWASPIPWVYKRAAARGRSLNADRVTNLRNKDPEK